MGGVVDDAPGIHHIEGPIGKRQGFSIDTLQCRTQPVQCEMRPRRLDGALSEVHTITDRAGTSPLQVIGTGPDPDLQDGLASMSLELRNSRDTGFHGIPMPLDLRKPLAAQCR
jgi:hypothetical protein